MEVVADSHVLFWWLSSELRGKLSRPALEALEKAGRISVPALVLLELLSLFERHGEEEKFPPPPFSAHAATIPRRAAVAGRRSTLCEDSLSA